MLPVLYDPYKVSVSEISKLKKLLASSQKELKALNVLHEEVLDIVDSANIEEAAEKERLMAELSDISEEFDRLTSAQMRSDLDQDEDDYLNDEGNDFKADERDISKAHQSICREIYRKIVNETHPDKVGDSGKVDFYHRAVEAYELLDLDELKAIYKLVFDKKARADYLKDLKNRPDFEQRAVEKEQLEIKISEIEYQIEDIKKDEFYPVMTMYTLHGSRVASVFYLNMLNTTIEFCKEKIAIYKRKIEMHRSGVFVSPTDSDEFTFEE